MNSKDGTEFEWYVNDKLPPFMVFYNDKDNLGAAKLLLYSDGKAELYLYDENAERFFLLNEWLVSSFDTEKKVVFPYGNKYGGE